jgi:pimeloyl-ACP methyl ester carboxylesterase
MGGYIALAFAEQYPNFTDRVVLLNSHPWEDSITRILARNREAELIQQGRKELLLNSFVQNNFSPTKSTHQKGIIELATRVALNQPENGMLADLAGMMVRTNKLKIFENPGTEIDIVVGSDDKKQPTMDLDHLSGEKTKIHWLTECGHMSILEKPTEVAQIIIAKPED